MLLFNWITFFGQGLNPDTAGWKDHIQPPCTPCFPGSSGSLKFGNTLLALSTVKWKIAVLCKAPSVPEVLQRYFSSLIIYPRNCGESVSLSDSLFSIFSVSLIHPSLFLTSFSISVFIFFPHSVFLSFLHHLFHTFSLSSPSLCCLFSFSLSLSLSLSAFRFLRHVQSISGVFQREVKTPGSKNVVVNYLENLSPQSRFKLMKKRSDTNHWEHASNLLLLSPLLSIIASDIFSPGPPEYLST